MEHWLFTQLKRNGVNNNNTINGPSKYDADIEQYYNSQANLFSIRFQDHFLGADGLPIKSLYKNDKLHYNVQGYKVWGTAIKDQVKSIINYQ
jgi:lysophospholipase L1-like esterase